MAKPAEAAEPALQRIRVRRHRPDKPRAAWRVHRAAKAAVRHPLRRQRLLHRQRRPAPPRHLLRHRPRHLHRPPLLRLHRPPRLRLRHHRHHLPRHRHHPVRVAGRALRVSSKIIHLMPVRLVLRRQASTTIGNVECLRVRRDQAWITLVVVRYGGRILPAMQKRARIRRLRLRSLICRPFPGKPFNYDSGIGQISARVPQEGSARRSFVTSTIRLIRAECSKSKQMETIGRRSSPHPVTAMGARRFHVPRRIPRAPRVRSKAKQGLAGQALKKFGYNRPTTCPRMPTRLLNSVFASHPMTPGSRVIRTKQVGTSTILKLVRKMFARNVTPHAPRRDVFDE